jgi:cation diffusion facilitator family transporter
MERTRLAYKEGIISVIINLLLFAVKYFAGIVSGSIALIADAWHTLSDSLSSIIVIVGVKLATRKPDKEHPFGHGRWEQIASIFIGFLLGIIAFDFLRESIIKFSAHESANFGTLAIIVTITSIIFKEGLAQYAFYIAKKTKNTAVKADGWHHRTDALSSIVVLAGIFMKDFFWWIDSALGVIIALMLFYAVYEIVKDAINQLLGQKPDPKLIEDVRNIVKEMYEEELYPHHFHLHNYGTQLELTFHLKFDKTQTIESCHNMATKIENELRTRLNVETTIHLEPYGVMHN